MTKGLSNYGFDHDLRDGEARQGCFRDILLGTGNGYRVEVKSDALVAQTGNVFVEYRQSGPPSYKPRASGIALLTSDWWAQELRPYDTWVVMPSRRMRAIARRAYLDPNLRRPGGDYNQTSGVLVPVHWLVQPLTEEAQAA